jgi:hypothetical protein
MVRDIADATKRMRDRIRRYRPLGPLVDPTARDEGPTVS